MPRQPPIPIPRMSGLLPKEVRDALIAASKLPDDLERRRAIEEATERAKRHHPQLFTKEQ